MSELVPSDRHSELVEERCKRAIPRLQEAERHFDWDEEVLA